MTIELDQVPFEIKSLIYTYVNFPTLKSLRLVSKSWASAGVALLFLPTFTIKSPSDIQRLFLIGTDRTTAYQAAKTIRHLSIPSQGWDPPYFRNIVCNRHELRREYEVMDFVPSQAEQMALDELSAVVNNDIGELVSALCHVPRVDGISITCENPFRHPILRKTWEEFDLAAFQEVGAQYEQLLGILQGAKAAGLKIQHLAHSRLLVEIFSLPAPQWTDLLQHTTQIESLNLTINDISFSLNDANTFMTMTQRLQELIKTLPLLKSLSLTFDILGNMPGTFLEPRFGEERSPTQGNSLHTLSLSGIQIAPETLFGFLEMQARTLRRLQLRNVELPAGTRSWRELLEELRERVGGTLEMFQLSGMVRGRGDENEGWFLAPVYDGDWIPVPENARNVRTRELEDFVLRGGHWPMVPSDNFPLS